MLKIAIVLFLSTLLAACGGGGDSDIDSDGDGVLDSRDIFPQDETETMDTDNDGIGDNADAFDANVAASVDDDNDGLPDTWNETCNIECQNNSELTLDSLLNDSDNDGVVNQEDTFPLDPNESADSDEDGVGDNEDALPLNPTETIDADEDGVGNNADAFDNNAAASLDADEDGLPDAWNEACDLDCQNLSELTLDQSLNDKDNDGVINEEDAFPTDPTETVDTDEDGVGNNADAFDNNAAASIDADEDGLPDAWNETCDLDCQNLSELTLDQSLNDTDNDGVINGEDAFPRDPTETVDSDEDGVGDNADAFDNNAAASIDADEDGLPDAWNEACDLDCQNFSELTLDQHLNDTDNDGVINEEDAFPADPTETVDTDEDGVGNNADAFDDNAAASIDADNDGLPDAWNEGCDESCQIQSELIIDTKPNDSDNDGVTNDLDDLPFDPSETVDSDEDGVGDNADAFDNNAAASIDADEDGLPDAWNEACDLDCQNFSELTLDQHLNDTDNDGVINEEDAFPADPTETVDTDEDGVGNNADAFDDNAAASIDADNDGLPDAWNEGCDESCQIQSELIIDTKPNDSDNDGVTNDLDDLPFDPSETVDSDEDGVGDNADAFVNNAAVSIDADEDGLPDAWNNTCNLDCQNTSGLTLDQHLNDTDNDGATNDVDVFPTDHTEQLDSDEDGIGNNADAFDYNAAVSVDEDNDGIPDEWNQSCDESCQTISELTLDQNLNDSDNDGVNNDLDDLPLDPTETLDTDGDKIGNNADTDDDGDNILDILDPKPLDDLNKDVDLAEITDGLRATSHQLFQLQAKTGSFVSGIGDINGDGRDDFAISSVRSSNIAEDANPVHIIFGGSRSVIDSQDIRYPVQNESMKINSLQKLYNSDSVYKTSNIGDVNGDGIDDLILVGDRYTDGEVSGAAIAYLFFGNENIAMGVEHITPLDADVIMTFGAPYAGREIVISGVGDFNDDGLNDFVVGIHSQPQGGKAYLILGRDTWNSEISVVDVYESQLTGADGMVLTAAGDLQVSGRTISVGEKFAYSIAGAGDVNNDGFDDIIIGVPEMNYFDTKTGGAFLIFGKSSLPATFEVSSVDGVNGVFLNPIGVAGYYDQIGQAVSGVGDINNDGIDDIALGSDRTETILLYGKENWDASHNLKVNSLQINAEVNQLLNLGDFNNDGIDDLVLGTTGSYNIMFGSSNFSSIWRYEYWLPILNPAHGKFDGDKGVSIYTAWTSGNSTDTSILGVAGDVDGDGKLDLIMGDTSYGESNQGISRVLYGYYPNVP